MSKPYCLAQPRTEPQLWGRLPTLRHPEARHKEGAVTSEKRSPAKNLRIQVKSPIFISIFKSKNNPVAMKCY